MDTKIKALIHKTRVFYLLFFCLYILTIAIKLLIGFNISHELSRQLVYFNVPLEVLCFVLEMLVISHFFRASLKFALIMKT